MKARPLFLAIAICLFASACSVRANSPTGPMATVHATSPVASSEPSSAATQSAHTAASEMARVDQIRKSCPSLLSWDDFHRSDRSLRQDKLPTGQTYIVSGPTEQRIHHNHYSAAVEPQRATILYVPLRQRPVTLATRWIFTPGGTSGENVVIGIASPHALPGHRRPGFGSGSLQLAVYPQYWRLFYVVNRNHLVQLHTLAIGDFRKPLRQDSRTRYQMALRVDATKSSLTIAYPGGKRNVRNPVIKKLWGTMFGIQVRRPAGSDGSANFLTVGSAAAHCSPSSLLGPYGTAG